MSDVPATIDRVWVEAFLTDRFGAGIDSVTPLTGGAWSSAFAYRLGGRDLVVRFSAFADAFRKDEIAARHGSVARPIPRILEIGEFDGGFYAVSERMFGDVLEIIDETQMRALLPSLMATLDALRGADVSDSTGFGGWGPDGNAPYATWGATLLDIAADRPSSWHHGWRSRLGSSPTGDGPFLEAFECLSTLSADLPDDRHLIHSDLLNRNGLVANDRVSAVFDWGSSMYGDFLLDLAWLCFWAPWTPAFREIDFREAAVSHYGRIGLDVPHFDERLVACMLWIGLDGQVYQASKGFWPELEWTAVRTLAIARQA